MSSGTAAGKTKVMKKKNNNDAVFFVLLAGITAALFVKCRYGIANIDESFYLTVPLRLIQGDALFTNEWNLSQTSGIFLVPFVKLYLSLHHSMEGILLTARYTCIIVQAVVSIFVYCSLKQYSSRAALPAAIGFLLYIPFSINALSYNSMSIFFLEISFLLIMNSRERKSFLIPAGIFFGMSVLCIPQLVILYFIYFAVLIIKAVKDKEKTGLKYLLHVSIGIAITAIAFLAFVFHRASMKDIMASLPLMLEDPTHQSKGIFSIFVSYFINVLTGTVVSPVIFSVYLILAGTFVSIRTPEKRQKVFMLLCGWCIISVAALVIRTKYLNFIVYPVNLLAPFAMVLSKNESSEKFFRFLWVPGMLYSYCLNLASDQAFYAISSASSTALPASLAILVLYGEGNDSVSMKRFLCTVVSVQLVAMFGLRATQVFWENDIRQQNTLITEGPEKGLLTTAGKNEKYLALLEDTKAIRTNSSAVRIVYLTDQTWLYLVNPGQRNASYSAWMAEINDLTFRRLKGYYQLNPDMMPDMVYVPSEQFGKAEQILAIWPYERTETEEGMILRKAG